MAPVDTVRVRESEGDDEDDGTCSQIRVPSKKRDIPGRLTHKSEIYITNVLRIVRK